MTFEELVGSEPITHNVDVMNEGIHTNLENTMVSATPIANTARRRGIPRKRPHPLQIDDSDKT